MAKTGKITAASLNLPEHFRVVFVTNIQGVEIPATAALGHIQIDGTGIPGAIGCGPTPGRNPPVQTIGLTPARVFRVKRIGAVTDLGLGQLFLWHIGKQFLPGTRVYRMQGTIVSGDENYIVLLIRVGKRFKKVPFEAVVHQTWFTMQRVPPVC